MASFRTDSHLLGSLFTAFWIISFIVLLNLSILDGVDGVDVVDGVDGSGRGGRGGLEWTG